MYRFISRHYLENKLSSRTALALETGVGTTRRLPKRRLSKRRLSKRRLSKRRLSKRRLSKRHLSKNRITQCHKTSTDTKRRITKPRNYKTSTATKRRLL